MRLAALALAVVATLLATPALAACPFTELPAKNVQVESGVTSDGLTNNRGEWNEQYLQAVARDGNQFSIYGRVADDQRFGTSDPSYESGIFTELGKHLIADLSGNFSPTHLVLPETIVSGGLDFRMAHGYGVQGHFAERTFPTQNAGITTVGFDRYAGQARVAVVLSFAQLSTVPGTALSETLVLARYLPCDNESVSFSNGRDVESTGVGSGLAVFKAIGYDLNDVHWISKRLALNIGAGWYLLIGAYNRFEVRIALRERL
jgi:YaiO family outer membrane protein